MLNFMCLIMFAIFIVIYNSFQILKAGFYTLFRIKYEIHRDPKFNMIECVRKNEQDN